MPMKVPLKLDPFKAADRNASFKGVLPVQQFKRLEGMLASMKGQVAFEFKLRRDDVLNYCAEGSVNATVNLICQRCMEPYEQVIAQSFLLQLVQTEAEAEQVDVGVDPLLIEADILDVIHMLEDELMLALPTVPKHVSESECQWHGWQEAEELPDRENPFGVLSSLKKH